MPDVEPGAIGQDLDRPQHPQFHHATLPCLRRSGSATPRQGLFKISPTAPAHRDGTDDRGSPEMISDAYLRARIAEVQQEFAAARAWLRRLRVRRRKAPKPAELSEH
ncbi:hypothetical protein GCM10017567_26060 [Amycolatopsis bullii]|uniref:Uncharacterized protein n=2 Tax=Amycolatopsis TaxID=1813 RepID=A0ABQ3K8X8_9PSEU|nr:hypothetical protein GCM10017567_26060 [Amycolatopsis bullii]